MLALLLGAGFSRYAGLPTMPAFGEVYEDRLKRVVNAEASGICGTDRLRRAGHTFAAFRKHCEQASPFIEIDANNLEELFCAAEAMEESRSGRIPLATGAYSVSRILEDLALWTWNVYQGPTKYFEGERTDTVPARYQAFMDWIVSDAGPVAVLTTNYDVLFETLALRANTTVRYPFESRPVWVNHGDASFLSTSRNAISVCKLHGSVNYFFAPDRSTLFVCSEIARKGDPAYGGSLNVERHTPLPAVVRLGTIGALRRQHGNLIPEIIAPTYAKLRETDWLQGTWNESVNVLRSATVLVIVGYSFPASDGFMRAMFLTAMAQRNKSTALHVMLVSPDARAWRRIRELFAPLARQDRLVWRRQKFENWKPRRDLRLRSWLKLE